MTGVVHLQHAILLADRPQDVVVVHHHDRGIDGIPPVLMASEEDGAALEEVAGEDGRSELQILEGADERPLVRLVLLLDVDEGSFHEIEGEGRRFHVEEASADGHVLLEDGGVEGSGLDDGNGVVVDDDVGVGVEDVDAETQNGLDDGELEGRDTVEGVGRLFDEGGGNGIVVSVVEGDGDVHGLEELKVRVEGRRHGVGEFILCDDEKGTILSEVAVLVEVDGEQSVGIGCDGNKHGVSLLSGENNLLETFHGLGVRG